MGSAEDRAVLELVEPTPRTRPFAVGECLTGPFRLEFARRDGNRRRTRRRHSAREPNERSLAQDANNKPARGMTPTFQSVPLLWGNPVRKPRAALYLIPVLCSPAL